MPTGIVYTETTVYIPPEQYAQQAPYQIAIIDLDGGGRRTVRITGAEAHIGDRVQFFEESGGVAYYSKAAIEQAPEPSGNKP
ncbi:MAG TPA: OB-fold domain-containing protein [Bryobacteraceae bacterium]|nr:OB-fold domain-containing protein [Bryobacteraceae bacterium]